MAVVSVTSFCRSQGSVRFPPFILSSCEHDSRDFFRSQTIEFCFPLLSLRASSSHWLLVAPSSQSPQSYLIFLSHTPLKLRFSICLPTFVHPKRKDSPSLCAPPFHRELLSLTDTFFPFPANTAWHTLVRGMFSFKLFYLN